MTRLPAPTSPGHVEHPPAAAELPVLLTPHLRGLMDPSDPEDPIRRQFLPSVGECLTGPGESEDPLSEREVEAVPRLLHRYRDRVLLLTTDRCAAHCRFCFRRESVGRRGWRISAPELRGAASYVAAHPEVREVILSGGDPLTLPGRLVSAILAAFGGGGGSLVRSDGAGRDAAPARRLSFRVHSRVPVVQPGRVDADLVARLAAVESLRLVIQANHPRELAPGCLRAIAALQAAGIPVLSQGVLLKGVNDSPGALAELWRRLVQEGIEPYYLFQPDLARGTSHFRVNLERALAIYRREAAAARRGEGRPVGATVPRFALDLPGGGGKVLVEECRILPAGPGFYRLEAPDGRRALYPVD